MRIKNQVSIGEVAGSIDHLLMDPYLTEKETIEGCYLAESYQVASVSVKPCYLRKAVTALNQSKVKVCTVIGFPFGIQSTSVKVAEAKRALTEGAQELEMVINLGYLLDENNSLFSEDIQEVCGLAHMNGVHIKVVLETGYLENRQIVKASQIAVNNGADWISSTTGYVTHKSNLQDLMLIHKAVSEDVKIKTALVSCTLSDFLTIRKLGYSRIGTRSTKEIMDAIKY